jgi:hypothetical protein
VHARFHNLTRNARRLAGVFFALGCAWLLSGCALLLPQTTALRDARPASLPESVELAEVPFFAQTDYECGPAALATTLSHGGAKVTLDEMIGQVYLPGRKGSLQVEMLAAARRHGMVSYLLAPKMEDMLREVSAGNPVIVLLDYGVWPFSYWHYAVVIGYNLKDGRLYMRSGEKRRLVMPIAVFEYLWKESTYWGMVTVPPDRIPVTATETAFLDSVLALERVADSATARKAYATYRQRWPDNLTASIGLANAQYATGDLADAETVLRDAAERHPDAVVVLNNLAHTLSDRGRNEEALSFIDRAVALGGPFADSVKETRELILKRLQPKP